MHEWYVVQVLSGQEKKVKKRIDEGRINKGLAEKVLEVVIPSEKVLEVKRGQQRISEKKLWPGYLLVKMEFDEESWDFVNGIDGIISFLGGSSPTPLSSQEVSQILQELEDKKKEVTQKHKVEVGDRVKITEGVFVNFIGTVLEVFYDKGRLSVLVSIFGRDTRVDDLEFWQVEQVSSESEV